MKNIAANGGLVYRESFGGPGVEVDTVAIHDKGLSELKNEMSKSLSGVCIKCKNLKIDIQTEEQVQTLSKFMTFRTRCEVHTHCPATMRHKYATAIKTMPYNTLSTALGSAMNFHEVNGQEKYALDTLNKGVENLDKGLLSGNYALVESGFIDIEHASAEIGEDELIDLSQKVDEDNHDRIVNALERASELDIDKIKRDIAMKMSTAASDHAMDAFRYGATPPLSMANVLIVEKLLPPDPDVPQGDLEDYGTW